VESVAIVTSSPLGRRGAEERAAARALPQVHKVEGAAPLLSPSIA
jgi:hypothetical protein